jgi:hypothetical protein
MEGLKLTYDLIYFKLIPATQRNKKDAYGMYFKNFKYCLGYVVYSKRKVQYVFHNLREEETLRGLKIIVEFMENLDALNNPII